MHQASIATSKRLQRVIQALKDYPEGFNITCEYIGRTDKGASVFRYKLVTA